MRSAGPVLVCAADLEKYSSFITHLVERAVEREGRKWKSFLQKRDRGVGVRNDERAKIIYVLEG